MRLKSKVRSYSNGRSEHLVDRCRICFEIRYQRMQQTKPGDEEDEESEMSSVGDFGSDDEEPAGQMEV